MRHNIIYTILYYIYVDNKIQIVNIILLYLVWQYFNNVTNWVNPWTVYCEGPPSFIWREGGGEGLKNWGTLSRGFGLRSFRPEIPAWGVFVGRRFLPGPKSPISPAENSACSREGRGGGGKGRGRGGEGKGGRGLTGSICPPSVIWKPRSKVPNMSTFHVGDLGNLIPIVNTHSGDCALSNSTVWMKFRNKKI